MHARRACAKLLRISLADAAEPDIAVPSIDAIEYSGGRVNL
jgi:hypothetical protein